MKPFSRFWIVLLLLLGIGAVFALKDAPRLYVYSRGVFLPSERLQFMISDESEKTKVEYTVKRVLNPLSLLRLKPNNINEILKVPEDIKTVTVKRATTILDRDEEIADIGKLKPGLYLIDFTLGQSKGMGIALVTDLGLVVKRNDNIANVFTATRSTGQHKTASIYAIGSNNQTEIKTDRNGLGKFELAEDKSGLIVANYGQHWAVSSSWWQNSVEEFKITGQTDSPLYNPGSTVNFRGNLRNAKDLKPVKLEKVNVIACNNYNEVWRGTADVNSFGTFFGTFSLSKSAKTTDYDTYQIGVRAQGKPNCEDSYSSSIATFQVVEYSKPDFTVSLQHPKAVVQGSEVKITSSAEYSSESALLGNKTTIKVYRGFPYDFDPRISDFGFGGDEWQYHYWDLKTKAVLEKTTTLDETGKLEVNVPLEPASGNSIIGYDIVTTVEDENHLPRTQTSGFLAYPSTVRVMVWTNRYVVKEGEDFEVKVRTRDLEGKVINAPVELTLVRRDYVYEQTRWIKREEKLETQTVSTNNGDAVTKFKSKPGGGYYVIARAIDPQNRVSVNYSFLWVTDENPSWHWKNDGNFNIQLDKSEYAVGDTAVAFISGIKEGADVWLTLEGKEIQAQGLTRTASGNAVWTFKITKEIQSNTELRAVFLDKNSSKESWAYVHVPKPVLKDRLRIEILPVKQNYAPGKQGQVNFKVSDGNGNPVQTELAVTVVDQDVYSLGKDRTLKAFDVLHPSLINRVRTISSEGSPLEIVIPRDDPSVIDPVDRIDPNDVALRPSVPSVTQIPSPIVKYRKNFHDTADWRASLITDENGLASITVPFPENLTTWRITARGQTVDAKAGEARANVMVTQDIVTRLSQPAFLVRGDSFQLRGIVNNNRSTATTGAFRFGLSGLNALAPLETNLSIQPGQRGFFDTTVTASKSGTAKITASFVGQDGGDALELPLEVKPRGFQDSLAWASDTKRSAKKFSLPGDASLQDASLKIALTPSFLSAVRPALEQLIGYPYGCTEQTLSRFLPTLLAQQTFPRDDLPEILDAGIARLETLRHGDGGWGFWSEDKSTLEMTSQVVLALARAKTAGVKFDAYLLNDAVQWLKSNLNNIDFQNDDAGGAVAVSFRALAEVGLPMPELMDKFLKSGKLEAYHYAQLALAYYKLGQLENARKMMIQLKKSRIESDSNVHWERPNRAYRWYYFWEDNPILVTAVALEALAKIEPNSKLIPKIINYLLQSRRGYWWVSTQDTAATVIAALALPKPKTSSQTVRVVLNGQEIAKKTIDETGATLEFKPNLNKGENTLEVKGNLNYAVSLEYAREPDELTSENAGINVTPTYYKLEKHWNENMKNWDLIPEPLFKDGMAQPLKVGDMIAVKILVKPESGSMRHLQVIQPVPAGFSAVKENGWQIKPGVAIEMRSDLGWWYWYAGRELYQDRVEMYANTFGVEQEFIVILRAQTPGRYTALPTTANLMYDPSVRGRSSGATLTITE